MFYNKIELVGKVTWITFGRSHKGNSYTTGYIQTYEIAEGKEKEFKKNYLSIKFIAFGETADLINALGTKKGSVLKVDGYIKNNSFKRNESEQEVNEIMLVVENAEESHSNVESDNFRNNSFFSSSKEKPYDPNDLEDDMPF